MNLDLVPVILCGGAGSRLWPVSREAHPKPFIKLADGESLLQKAFLRGVELPGVKEVMTVTNRDLFFRIEDELYAVNKAAVATSYVLEPVGRNTAAAIAAACLQAERTHGSECTLLVLAADHLIEHQANFSQAVATAVELAAQGKLVTFGIQPDSPETGYGYIEASGHEVLRFVEKPSLDKAQEYVAGGRHLWNSGIFCFRVCDMLTEMQALCPDILLGVQTSWERARSATGERFVQVELDSASFEAVQDLSIDYAVMEKTSRIAVVPCDIGWNDIGSWSALGDLDVADEKGNRLRGEALLHDTSNTTVFSPHRLVGAVGVHNLFIIDTPDALLVADKSRSQDVKHLYAQLKAQGHEAHKFHRTVHRPWGTYTVLEEGVGFKIKRIEVKPGASLSLQMHHHRSEHWVVVSGTATVVNGEQELTLLANESTYIPAGHRHRLMNPGKIEVVLIEVQTGAYLGEDDIVRFSDVYGRA